MGRRGTNINLGFGSAILGIIAVTAVYFTIDNAFYSDEYRSSIRERESIAVELERKRADEAALRAEQRTEFQSGVMSGLESLGGLAFFALIGGMIIFFASAGTRVQRRRIENSNDERFKVLDNPRLMLDVKTGETIDRQNGCVHPNQTTDQKLLIMGQAARIEALGNMGQKFSAAMGKTAVQGWQPKALDTPTRQTMAHAQLPEPAYSAHIISNTAELMEYATANEWHLGQAGQTGELSTFKLKDDVNLLISGARGQGKSELAKLLMAYARMNGLHTVIADGKGGVDFRRYGKAGIVEWFDMNADTLYPFLYELNKEYERRLALMVEVDADEIDEYNRLSRKKLKRVFVIIEEYIGTLKLIKAEDTKLAKACVGILGAILSRARATGIHICILSQTLDSQVFDNSIKANLKYLTYKLPGRQYQVLDVPKLVKQLPQFTFLDYEESEEVSFSAQFASNDLDLMKLEPQREQMFLPVLGGITLPQKSGSIGKSGSQNHFSSSVSVPEPLAEPPQNQYKNIDWVEFSMVRGPSLDAMLMDLPKLMGEPVEVEEVQYVIDAWAAKLDGLLPSQNAVFKAVWGCKNDRTLDWLNDIKDEYFHETTD